MDMSRLMSVADVKKTFERKQNIGIAITIGMINKEFAMAASTIVATPGAIYRHDISIWNGSSSSMLLISCENRFTIRPTGLIA